MPPAIHFTADDLANVRIARTPSAMVETIFSIRQLDPQCAGRIPQGIGFRAWASELRPRLGKWLWPVTSLIPHAGGGLDLFRMSAMDMSDDLDSAVQTMLDAPPASVERELHATLRPMPSFAARLPTDTEARRAVVSGLQRYFRTAVVEHWNAIRAITATRRRQLADQLAYGGVDALLSNLHHTLRWNRPVLELHGQSDGYTPELMRLNGRGLVIVPSAMSRGLWVLTAPDHSDLPWHVVLPVAHASADQAAFWTIAGIKTRPLADLIGRTRANLLHEIADGGNTSQLAARTGISVASASTHAAVLRATGLIRSERRGTQVTHHLTELGRELLG